MTQKQQIQLFGEKKVRSVWDSEQEKWYFSIVDVCAVLTDSKNPQTYWRVLKNRLKKEGNETVTNCNASKMRAADVARKKRRVIKSNTHHPSPNTQIYVFHRFLLTLCDFVSFLRPFGNKRTSSSGVQLMITLNHKTLTQNLPLCHIFPIFALKKCPVLAF